EKGDENKEPPPPPPDSIALEMAKRKGIPAVQEWITGNSTSDFLSDAMDWLTDEKTRLHRTCLSCADTTCLVPCYEFLNHFRGDAKEDEVRAHIKKLTTKPPPPPPRKDPEKEAFLQCLELEDKAASLECLKQLLEDNPDHPLKEQILEHVDRLEPIKYQREKSGNTYVYQLSHVKNPRWKDISQDYGMVVDDSKLLSDKQLRIKLNDRGKYKLFLEDEWGKQDTIELANIFNAVLDKVSTGYQLFVEGGNPPYQVQLVNLSSNEAEKTYDGIQDSLIIPDQDVASLSGKEYLVWVYDGGGLSKTKAGEFTTPIKENNWPAFLTLIAIAIILMLLVVYLLWYFRKRRAQQLMQQTA
ncbi:MAG: hypothetical protein KDC44_13360, partial [Phaeodactylibacter sp.]|nr:hypothetical protein [Phaeodactylibacter sp.]